MSTQGCGMSCPNLRRLSLTRPLIHSLAHICLSSTPFLDMHALFFDNEPQVESRHGVISFPIVPLPP